MSIEDKAENVLDELVSYRNGQRREPQIRLAKGLARHLDNGKPLLVEAPTGVGKSFAAIAAARASGEKTLISTYTHGLQQQLQKDATMLSEATSRFDIAILKGRSSYLCKLKESQAQHDAKDFDDPDEAGSELSQVLDWGEETETGDKSELPFAVSAETWSQVSVSADQCAGKQCPFFKTCFAEVAKAKAKTSDIAVVNHALVAQGMKQDTFLDNAFPNIIIDEAHEFTHAVGEAFGAHITLGKLKWALNKVRRLASIESKTKYENALDYILRYGKNVKEPLRHLEGHALSRQIAILMASLTQWIVLLDNSKANKDYILKQSLYTLNADLELAAQGDTHTQTSWIEWFGENFTIRSVLFNPGNQIKMNLVDKYNAAAFMSATLKVGNSFNNMANEVGIRKLDWTGAQLPHLFDYQKNGLIWYPERLKDSGDPLHVNQVATISKHVVKAANGRTLILCTSWRNVNAISEKLSTTFPDMRIIAQKPGVNIKHLADEFNSNPHSVLIGTMSLWTGVSFEGHTCVSVIMDKIPFPSPANPVIAARLEQYENNGSNGFMNVLVSEAARTLKQGAGRLIRTPTDEGVFICCDPRMNPKSQFYKRSYGKVLQDSLPPMKVTYDTQEALGRLKDLNEKFS